jgi:hypothetical protein
LVFATLKPQFKAAKAHIERVCEKYEIAGE